MWWNQQWLKIVLFFQSICHADIMLIDSELCCQYEERFSWFRIVCRHSGRNTWNEKTDYSSCLPYSEHVSEYKPIPEPCRKHSPAGIFQLPASFLLRGVILPSFSLMHISACALMTLTPPYPFEVLLLLSALTRGRRHSMRKRNDSAQLHGDEWLSKTAWGRNVRDWQISSRNARFFC